MNERQITSLCRSLADDDAGSQLVRDRRGVVVGLFVPVGHARFRRALKASGAPSIRQLANIEAVRAFVVSECFRVAIPATGASAYLQLDIFLRCFASWSREQGRKAARRADVVMAMQSLGIPYVQTNKSFRGIVFKRTLLETLTDNGS